MIEEDLPRIRRPKEEATPCAEVSLYVDKHGNETWCIVPGNLNFRMTPEVFIGNFQPVAMDGNPDTWTTRACGRVTKWNSRSVHFVVTAAFPGESYEIGKKYFVRWNNTARPSSDLLREYAFLWESPARNALAKRMLPDD